VQVCGAIKNVYAIAAGVIDGCGWSENTRAAMLTRAVAEAGLYLKKHKGKRSTLMGLSGFGDLYLTCSSRMSRNYQVGLSLAANIPLSQAVARLGHVAEGVATTRLIHQRASLLGVEMPIVAAVHQILDGGKTPQECAAILMARNITYEKRSSAAALGMISPDLV
jgi:glycerol-3-phosphate dehydrogenase (NAD(P)+)